MLRGGECRMGLEHAKAGSTATDLSLQAKKKKAKMEMAELSLNS